MPSIRHRMNSDTTRPTHVERTQQASRSDVGKIVYVGLRNLTLCRPHQQEVSAVTVEEVAQLSPTVKRFTLRAENCKLTFKPGQW